MSTSNAARTAFNRPRVKETLYRVLLHDGSSRWKPERFHHAAVTTCMESAEIVIARHPSLLVLGQDFDESRNAFFSKECDFDYDCVSARDKIAFIGKPDHIGARCFESGRDHFACITLAFSTRTAARSSTSNTYSL